MKKLVAITGGIGSGKSEVLRNISQLGYFVLSADDINRELLVDSEYLVLLKSNFPLAFDENGLNKKKLADIIFNDDSERLRLNSIAHKRIRQLVSKKMKESDAKVIFVEVPLLIESGMADMFDEIIVVIASHKDRLNRVISRDNINKTDVEKRINSQLSDAELIKYATYQINNNGTLEDLRDNTKAIIDKIVK